MQYTEGKIGRVFILRLEDGEPLLKTIESFAKEKDVLVGHVALIGCVKNGHTSCGPVDAESDEPVPIKVPISDVYETVATGIIAPDVDNNPILHLHGALGRDTKTQTGCIREEVEAWLVNEVVLYEIKTNNSPIRAHDPVAKLSLLKIEEEKRD